MLDVRDGYFLHFFCILYEVYENISVILMKNSNQGINGMNDIKSFPGYECY